MGRHVIRHASAILLLAIGLILAAGCQDQTRTPENQAATAKRQETIKKHKNGE